jgi:hypothetical protein
MVNVCAVCVIRRSPTGFFGWDLEAQDEDPSATVMVSLKRAPTMSNAQRAAAVVRADDEDDEDNEVTRTDISLNPVDARFT